MQLKNRNDFPYLIDELNLTGVGIEIGVDEGKYSEILMQSKKISRFVFLDSWKEDPKISHFYGSQKKLDSKYEMVVEKLKKYGERASIVRKNSTEAVFDFSDDFFDFIFIDADHSYEAIKKDLVNWYPKLKKGGVFSGHDYIDKPPCFGVKQAVDQFVEELEVSLVIVPERKGLPSWYWVK